MYVKPSESEKRIVDLFISELISVKNLVGLGAVMAMSSLIANYPFITIFVKQLSDIITISGIHRNSQTIVEDINKDGKQDLLCVDYQSDKTVVKFVNDAFSPTKTIQTFNEKADVSVNLQDLNDDGLKDLIVTKSQGDSVLGSIHYFNPHTMQFSSV